MSDLPAESAVGTPEAGAPTTPKFSAASTPAPASQPGFSEDALIEKLMTRMGGEIDKRFQSAKDKRLSAIDRLGGVDDLVKLKEYIKAKPTDPDGAIRDFQLDQLLAERSQPAAQVSPEVPVRTAQADPTSDVQAWTTDILSEAGVDWNADEGYKALAAKPYANPEQFKTAVVKFVAQKAKQAFQPGAASNSAAGGAAPGTTDKAERKAKLYERLGETQKEPTRFKDERARIKAELDKLG